VEFAVLEIGVAARAMNHADPAAAKQPGVAARKIVGVDGEQVFAENALPLKMPDWRPQAAVGHVAAVAGDPLEHRAAAMREHLKLLVGFGDMHGEREVAGAGALRGEPQQFRRGGIRRVRRKRHARTPTVEQIKPVQGFLDDFRRRTAAFHTGHFKKGNHAQGRGRPDIGQEFVNRFDVADGGDAGAQEHSGAAEPGFGKVGVNDAGLAGGDEFDPVNEGAGRRDFPGHVSVIKMAMGIDQTGQKNDLAEIKGLLAVGGSQVAPAANGNNAIAREPDGAIGDGRSGDGEDDAGAKNGGRAVASGWLKITRHGGAG
jgi:hypothetical protein